MPFGTDFETGTDNSDSVPINCHCHFIRRSCSKERYIALVSILINERLVYASISLYKD